MAFRGLIMSFDKVSKSIKEPNQLITPYHESTNYLRKLLVKIPKLNASTKVVFCRWLRYGFIEGVQAEVLPIGTVILTDWSSEVDSVIHELLDNEIATQVGNGYVEIPFMMTAADQLDLSLVCDGDDYSLINDGEVIYPSPLIMKVPHTKEVVEEPYDDLTRSVASMIRKFNYYLSGKIIHVGINVKSIGMMSTIVFRHPIDILVVTDNHYSIAHRVLDPNKTVHRGLSALEGYLMDGVDYAVLVHKYTHYEAHVETFNKIINRQYIMDSGFVLVPNDFDYMIFLKWPRANSLMRKSQSVVSKHSLINSALTFMINAR